MGTFAQAYDIAPRSCHISAESVVESINQSVNQSVSLLGRGRGKEGGGGGTEEGEGGDGMIQGFLSQDAVGQTFLDHLLRLSQSEEWHTATRYAGVCAHVDAAEVEFHC